MSREAIAQTVAKMRSATDKGMSEMMFRKDAIRVVHQFADQVEADVADILAENARLRDALKYAIPWACLKCTLWNSRAARCSLGSGMCDQVWKWKQLLGEVSK